MKWYVLTTKQVMEVFNCSRQTLTNWVEAGCPKLRRGVFDVRHLVKWNMEREKARLEARLKNLGLEENESRLKLAQAERAELDLAIKRAEYIDLDAVRTDWASHINTAKTQLLSIPAKLAIPLAACDNAAGRRALIEQEIRRALDELSRDTLPAPAAAPARARPVAGRALEASVEAHREPVGRRKAHDPHRGKPRRTRAVAHVAG